MLATLQAESCKTKGDLLFERRVAFQLWQQASTPLWKAQMEARYDAACDKVGAPLPCHCCSGHAVSLEDGKPVCATHQ